MLITISTRVTTAAVKTSGLAAKERLFSDAVERDCVDSEFWVSAALKKYQ